MNYKDQLYKLESYKQRIIDEFIQKGIYPSSYEIDQALSRIDSKLSYFKVYEAEGGEVFNVEAYNAMIAALFEDFKLLYRLLKETVHERYDFLKNYADTHLKILEDKTDFYLLKSEQEVATTSLGKTVDFIKAPFVSDQEGHLLRIALGTHKLIKGSHLFILVNGYNLSQKLSFKVVCEGSAYYMNAYNFNHELFKVPGTLPQKTYTYQTIASQTESIVALPHPLKADHDYTLLVGKDTISVKALSHDQVDALTQKNSSKYFNFTHRSYIDFYTYDADAIQFRFSKEPLSCNFIIQDSPIRHLNTLHHFFLEMPENSSFEIFLSKGEIYSGKAKGAIKNNVLYYPLPTRLTDFKVIETNLLDTIDAEISCEVYGISSNELTIESFLIKERTD